MNTTIDTDTVTTKRAATKRTAKRPTSVVAAPVDQGVELVAKRPASEVTRLVFMALLGCAACIALVGVVSQASEAGTSPDDPAPELITEFTG